MTFTVYDNITNKIIVSYATWEEIEDYIDCKEKYTVVCNLNGEVM